VNTKKVSFNQIGSLVAQVVDAKALGVSNSKDNVSTPRGRRQAQDDEVDSSEQNKMVKVTETYNPTTKVAEDKTLEVVFTRTTNTQTTELQTGMDTYVATADDITTERLTDEPGRVVIKNVPNHEFRALNGEIVLQDWTSSNQETIEFLFTKLETGTFTKVATAPDLDINALIQPDSPAGQIILTNNLDYEFRLINGETELVTWTKYETDTITFEFDDELTPTIEARGVDATIIFDAIEGLTYDVTLGGVPVSSDITDNGSLDEDSTAGMIILSGLTEGLTYDIAFEGQLPDAALTGITIESRSTDASISFTAFEGFTYAIKSGENTLLSNVVDNDTNDINEKEGVITIKGLIQGLPYDVHYSGYVVLETITQEEVDGQVDKLYVLYQYTFISFVPLTLNTRPEKSRLLNDYDGVAMYDKSNYYSDQIRQSFVVDNDTGLIYKIENTNIANLSGGCISIKDNQYPFDMKINNNKELEFYTLYQNPSITTIFCIKDKYGRKYVNNNRINQYDEQNKTHYFVTDANYVSYGLAYNTEGKNVAYWLTNTGEVVRTEPGGNSFIYRVMGNGNNHRAISEKDSLEIYVSMYMYRNLIQLYTTNHSGYFPGGFVQPLVLKVKVHNGVIYEYRAPNDTGENNSQGFRNWSVPDNKVIMINGSDLDYFRTAAPPKPRDEDIFGYGHYTTLYTNFDYFEDYGLSIYYVDENVVYYNNYWDNYIRTFTDSSFILNTYGLNHTFGPYINPHGGSIMIYQSGNFFGRPKKLEFLKGALVENGKLIKVELSGNVNYEIVPEFINGEWLLTPYISGTYVAPPAATITFQPINN
jgi:hypothetical protein